MKFVLSLTLVMFAAAPVGATTEDRSINRIASMQAKADGSYDVICLDGTSETATSADLTSDKVCGGTTAPLPITGIRAAIRKSEGVFDVLCSNNKVEQHTSGSLRAGVPCFSIGKQVWGGSTSSTTSRAMYANTLYFYSVDIKTAGTVVGWGFGLGENRDPQVVMGIYSSDDKGLPDKLVAQSDVFDVENIRLYLLGGKSENIPVGKYWIAYVMSNNLTLAATAASTTSYRLAFPFATKLPAKVDPTACSPVTESYYPQAFALAK